MPQMEKELNHRRNKFSDTPYRPCKTSSADLQCCGQERLSVSDDMYRKQVSVYFSRVGRGHGDKVNSSVDLNLTCKKPVSRIHTTWEQYFLVLRCWYSYANCVSHQLVFCQGCQQCLKFIQIYRVSHSYCNNFDRLYLGHMLTESKTLLTT